MEDLLAVHGHGEATSVEWIDAPHGDLEGLPTGRRARRRAARAASQQPSTADPAEATPAEPPSAETPAESPRRSVPPERDTASDLPRRFVPPETRSEAEAGANAADTDLPPVRSRTEPSTEPPAGSQPTAPTFEQPSPMAPSSLVGGPSVAPPTPAQAPLSSSAPPSYAPRSAANDLEHRDEREDTSGEKSPRSRAAATSVQPAQAPLLSSRGEAEPRNGHLDIDTAPLLLTFRERGDEPVAQYPRRRGGRHRRVDPDAAG